MEVAVLCPEFFGHTGYVRWYQDFNKSIGQCTVRQTEPQRLRLYLATFRCQAADQSSKIIS